MVELRRINVPYPASEAVIGAILRIASMYDSSAAMRFIPEPNPTVRVLLASVIKCGNHNVIEVDGLQLNRGDIVLIAAVRMVRTL